MISNVIFKNAIKLCRNFLSFRCKKFFIAYHPLSIRNLGKLGICKLGLENMLLNKSMYENKFYLLYNNCNLVVNVFWFYIENLKNIV